MRTIVGMLALLSLVIIVPAGYSADKAESKSSTQRPLSPEEKLSRQEAAAERESFNKDLEKTVAERERRRIETEQSQLSESEKAQQETDKIREQLQDEIIKAQQKAEQDAELARKALEEEQSRAIHDAIRVSEEEAKQLERELQKMKVSPPPPR